MDFHKAMSVENSESDKLLKTFIFMNTLVILYILRLFVADPMQICLALRVRPPHLSAIVKLKNSLTYRLVAGQNIGTPFLAEN